MNIHVHQCIIRIGASVISTLEKSILHILDFGKVLKCKELIFPFTNAPIMAHCVFFLKIEYPVQMVN